MKAATNKYISCLMLILVIGCKTNDTNLSSIITSSNCFWDVHDSYSVSNRKVGYCYKFRKDGSCSYLFYDRQNVRNGYDFDDNIPTTKTWKLKGDTVLYILGLERTIVGFTKDTILLENPTIKEKDTLIRNCK